MHPHAKAVAKALNADASKRFNNDHMTSVERMALDAEPRTKSFPAILGFGASDQLEVKKQFSKFMYGIEQKLPKETSQTAAPNGSAGESELDAFDVALAALDETLNAAPGGAGDVTSQQEMHPALEKYLDSTPAVPLSSPNFDPLIWHERRRAESLVLYLASVLLLGLALTSARNERAFSVACHFLHELSTQLSPEILECRILIKRNRKPPLHTVEKTMITKNSQGKPMGVKVAKRQTRR